MGRERKLRGLLSVPNLERPAGTGLCVGSIDAFGTAQYMLQGFYADDVVGIKPISGDNKPFLSYAYYLIFAQPCVRFSIRGSRRLF